MLIFNGYFACPFLFCQVSPSPFGPLRYFGGCCGVRGRSSGISTDSVLSTLDFQIFSPSLIPDPFINEKSTKTK